MLSDDEKAYVLALVYRHIELSPEYMTWIPGYTCIREANRSLMGFPYGRAGGIRSIMPTNTSRGLGIMRHEVYTITGHYRRKAMCRQMLRSLKCVTKFEEI